VFGSNFEANFGIPNFGYQGADAQGGYLGPNAPAPSGQQQPGSSGAPPPAAGIAAPQSASQPSLGESPLSPGALAPGGASLLQQPAAPPDAPGAPPPAAGIGSPFGKPGL